MPEFKLEPIESWQAGGKATNSPLSEFGDSQTAEQLACWIETLLQIQTASITRNDFYQAAAEATVNLIGLHDGMIILKKQNQWQVAASYARDIHSQESWDENLLRKVEQERATFYEFGNDSKSETGYVASPIFDTTDKVAGVLYGTRNRKESSGELGSRKIEALSMQLLSGIVGAGLARQVNQEETNRIRMQLEQFASAKLVAAMSEDPTFLDSRERTISVLFGDVRGFTGLAQRVGPEKTFSMIRNLMDQLTGSILDEEGFIIDYAGDGIAAMWNAPADQPDHAELACWAAINMQKVMDKLSEFWSFVAGESLSARIGINTGVAHVGNSGSRWRLKYSPLGASVNLASRLEGANKYFGTSILVSEETKGRMFSSFPLRRVGPVLVKGSMEPVEVFQLMTEPEAAATDQETIDTYDLALDSFLQKNFEVAIKILEPVSENELLASRLLDESRRLLHEPREHVAIQLDSK